MSGHGKSSGTGASGTVQRYNANGKSGWLTQKYKGGSIARTSFALSSSAAGSVGPGVGFSTTPTTAGPTTERG